MRYTSILLLFISLPAFAEVSDKMASIPQLWLQGVVGAIILLFLVRLYAWVSILGVLIVAFFGIASYQTFADPYVGPAILNEQGTPYVISSYGSVVLMAVGLVGGVILNRRRRKNGT